MEKERGRERGQEKGERCQNDTTLFSVQFEAGLYTALYV